MEIIILLTNTYLFSSNIISLHIKLRFTKSTSEVDSTALVKGSPTRSVSIISREPAATITHNDTRTEMAYQMIMDDQGAWAVDDNLRKSVLYVIY